MNTKKILVVVCFLLVITNVLTLLQKRNAAKLAASNAYPLIDPAREFISQEHYIINIQNLRNYLIDLGKQYPDTISIYYEQLNSGANIAIHKDLRLFPASLNKIPMAIIAVKKVEDGEWNWNTEFTAVPEDLDSGSGELYKTAENNKISIQKLLEALIIDSDNTAYQMFSKRMELKDFSSFQDEI